MCDGEKLMLMITLGSGVSDIKCILAGVSLNKLLSPWTLLAKCVGLMVLIGSGFVIGKAAPFVHVSCMVCNQLSKFQIFRRIRKVCG